MAGFVILVGGCMIQDFMIYDTWYMIYGILAYDIFYVNNITKTQLEWASVRHSLLHIRTPENENFFATRNTKHNTILL